MVEAQRRTYPGSNLFSRHVKLKEGRYMSRHSRVKYVLPASVLRGRRVVGGKRAGKGFPEEPPLPPPTFPLPCSGAPGAVDVSGRAEPLSPPSFGGKKGGPQRRDALHGPREARVPRVCNLHHSRAERGVLGVGLLCQARPSPEHPFPTPGSPRAGPALAHFDGRPRPWRGGRAGALHSSCCRDSPRRPGRAR